MEQDGCFNEKVFVQGLKNGDPFAFEKIFSLYNQKLYRFSLSYLKSAADAEDVVEEVFYKLWQNRKSIKTEESFQAYLFTITLNFIKRNFNKKSRDEKYRADFLNGHDAVSYHPESSIIYQDLLDKLEQLVERLPAKRKQIFIERRINEKPVKQIAREMGVAPKTVENQLTRVVAFLKNELHNESYGGKQPVCLFA